jgi:hypothetical protein
LYSHRMAQARKELLGLRCRNTAWGYRKDGTPSVEPTALACLALLAGADCSGSAGDRAAIESAASWLKSIQRPDGALPVSERLPAPGWSTSYAILLWNAQGAHQPARKRGCKWLLSIAGETHRPGPGDEVVGHDPSLPGWPWVQGTHSWVEPTAVAILALCREGLREHARVRLGTEMILDRALEHGGWNCGNKTVFGRELRPQPGPTALALLALAATRQRSAVIAPAVDYLRRMLPGVTAPVSLAWGVLALRAHHALPAACETWLSEAASQAGGKPVSTMNLALLLLAAEEAGLGLILPPAAGERPGALSPDDRRFGADASLISGSPASTAPFTVGR